MNKDELEQAIEAEEQMVRGYNAIAKAHRYRSLALDRERSGNQDESHYFYAQSEAFFDVSEEHIRRALDVDSVHVARYTIDVAPYRERIKQALSTLYKIDLVHCDYDHCNAWGLVNRAIEILRGE